MFRTQFRKSLVYRTTARAYSSAAGAQSAGTKPTLKLSDISMPVGKVAALACLTYFGLHAIWYKLEIDEVRANHEAEMADLKQQIEELKHKNWIRRTQNLIAELPSTDRSQRLEEIKQEIAQIKTDAQDLPQTVSESITALERHVDSLLTGDGTESSNGALGTVKSLLWK